MSIEDLQNNTSTFTVRFGGAYSIGTSQRSNPLNINAFTPSCQEYNPKYDLVIKSQPQWKMSYYEYLQYKQKEKEKEQQTKKLENLKPHLSPQQYEIKSAIGESPKITIKGKIEPLDKKDFIGPTKYSPKIDIFRQSHPQFSFGYRQPKIKFDKTEVPGPGQYHGDHFTQFNKIKKNKSKSSKENSPNQKLLKSSKTSYIKYNNNPGPGNYEIRDTFKFENTPQYKFSKQEKSSFKSVAKDINLGPGSYEENEKPLKKKMGYTFSKKQNNNLKTESSTTPGPGHYEVEEVKWSDNKIKFKKSKRKPLLGSQTNPGPGEYDQESYFQFMKSERQKYSIGQSQRFYNDETFTPGPGTYNVRRNIVDNKHIQLNQDQNLQDDIKNLRRNPKQEITPGPSDYVLEEYTKEELINRKICNINGNVRSTFNKSKRFKNDSTLGPGPAKYYYRDEFDEKNITFGYEKKSKWIQENNNPGSGQYNLSSYIGGVPSYLGNQSKDKNEKYSKHS